MTVFPDWFPILVLFSIPASIVGYTVGRLHIRYLAFHGGESIYPAPIPETVAAYRELHYVDELQRYSVSAVVALLMTATITLSVVTVGMLLAYFTVGYYFATKVIRALADADGADKPQLFNTE